MLYRDPDDGRLRERTFREATFRVNEIGEPADTTLQEIEATRKVYTTKQGFESKKMQQRGVLEFALNPPLLPEQSKRVPGWALDIEGDLAGAAAIASGGVRWRCVDRPSPPWPVPPPLPP